MNELSTSFDKRLYTPGPLTTSRTVKQALLRDLGSRDRAMIGVIREIRQRLIALGRGDENTFTAIPLQGSGTYALEAVVSSAIPANGKLLIVVNGAYGRRVAQMARIHRVPMAALEYPEDRAPDPAQVDTVLRQDPGITHVCMCHCETTSGIFNPLREVGEAVAGNGRRYFVDAMSSFGAVPVDLEKDRIDYLVSSANKCIEGVPGFSFVVARLTTLLKTEGCARTLSLDLLDQHRGFEKNGQFRFTPPTHALLGFHQALLELEAEGGVEGRAARYRSNYETLRQGMRELGFREYLEPALQGYIISTFHCPRHPAWSFERFYDLLSQEGFLIYPGKVGSADCFRIGHIGRLFPSDMRDLLGGIRRTLDAMGVRLN